jgi:hypothetical protein
VKNSSQRKVIMPALTTTMTGDEAAKALDGAWYKREEAARLRAGTIAGENAAERKARLKEESKDVTELREATVAADPKCVHCPILT